MRPWIGIAVLAAPLISSLLASPLPTSGSTRTSVIDDSSTTTTQLAVPTPQPQLIYAPQILERNHAGPLTPLNYSGTLVPDSTTSASVTQDTNSTTAGYDPFFAPGISTQLLDWVAIVVVVSVAIAIAAARYFYLRRFYRPTLRSYFLPPAGIHINSLNLHIRAPPPRPIIPVPTYLLTPTARTRRRRRDRDTRGENIGPGGVRAGPRDQDDQWQGDASSIDDGDLPKYAVDIELPAYAHPVPTATPGGAEIRAATTTSTTPPTPPTPNDSDTIPSVQSYEAATRGPLPRPLAPTYDPSTPPRIPQRDLMPSVYHDGRGRAGMNANAEGS